MKRNEKSKRILITAGKCARILRGCSIVFIYAAASAFEAGKSTFQAALLQVLLTLIVFAVTFLIDSYTKTEIQVIERKEKRKREFVNKNILFNMPFSELTDAFDKNVGVNAVTVKTGKILARVSCMSGKEHTAITRFLAQNGIPHITDGSGCVWYTTDLRTWTKVSAERDESGMLTLYECVAINTVQN